MASPSAIVMYAWSPLPRNLDATFRDVEHPKPRVRLSAIADLARWAQSEHRERCVERLVAAMQQDVDVEVRAAAALALADAQATDSVAALLDVAARGEPRLRQMALVAIGELAEPGDGAALEMVRAGLSSEAPALRFQALVAANRLFSAAELEPALRVALADPESKIRYVACRIVEERFLAEGRADSPAAMALRDELTGLLSDADASVALVAAIVLGRFGSSRAQELVIAALNRPNAFTQLDDEQAAIELCADLRLERARPGLEARAFGGFLGAASPLAFQARVALAKLGHERARAQIVRGLSSWSRAVRSQSVAAVGQARLEAARPRLLEMRRDERQADARLVAEALRALDG